MADTNLQTDSVCKQPLETVHTLATELQTLAHRVDALALAAEDIVDYAEEDERKRLALGRAHSLIEVILETSGTLADKAEQIEIIGNNLLHGRA
jgi:signal transduction histidine kinase